MEPSPTDRISQDREDRFAIDEPQPVRQEDLLVSGEWSPEHVCFDSGCPGSEDVREKKGSVVADLRASESSAFTKSISSTMWYSTSIAVTRSKRRSASNARRGGSPLVRSTCANVASGNRPRRRSMARSERSTPTHPLISSFRQSAAYAPTPTAPSRSDRGEHPARRMISRGGDRSPYVTSLKPRPISGYPTARRESADLGEGWPSNCPCRKSMARDPFRMSGELRLAFVVESGTDVRLVEGLNRHFRLDLVCRNIVNGFHVNWQPRAELSVVVGPAGRLAFAAFLARRLATQKEVPEIVLVQGYAAAALVANVVGRLRGASPVMLVCSPVEAYYECRRTALEFGGKFRRSELLGLHALARLNAVLGRNYVVLSRFLREVVTGHGARGSIDVIPVYGVDVARFSPSHADKGTLRRQLGLPGMASSSSSAAGSHRRRMLTPSCVRSGSSIVRGAWCGSSIEAGGMRPSWRERTRLVSRVTSWPVVPWTLGQSYRASIALLTSACRPAGRRGWASRPSRRSPAACQWLRPTWAGSGKRSWMGKRGGPIPAET